MGSVRGKFQGPFAGLAALALANFSLTACNESPSAGQISTAPAKPAPAKSSASPSATARTSEPELATQPTLQSPVAPESPAASPAAEGPPEARAAGPTKAEISLKPRDECAALPGWSAFHARLAQAIKARDRDGFAALAMPEVRLDYGGGAGRAELRKRLDDPARGLWAELDQLLLLGCAVEGELVVLPWFFWNVPEDIDPYMAMVVTGKAVPIFAKPSADAKVVARLDWPLVSTRNWPSKESAFTAVTTRAGTKGYVRTSALRGLLGYRLIAERRGENWQISAFIAGD